MKEGIEHIGSGAFSETPLKAITVPNTLTTIGDYAFHRCTSLSDVHLSNRLKVLPLSIFEGCYYLESIVLPEGLETIGERAFADCAITKIVLPESLKTIGKQAFASSENLKEIKLPPTIVSLGAGVFTNTGLESITIPDSISSIPDGAFGYCEELTSINLPSTIVSIGDEAFIGDRALIGFVAPPNLTSIGNSAFAGCVSVSELKLNSILETIGDNAFKKTSIKTVVLPTSVYLVGAYAFSDCAQLTSVQFMSSTGHIGPSAFSGCATLSKLSLPKDLEEIPENLCESCTSLKSITIPSNVFSIGSNAFKNAGLTTINIPASVVGFDNAFTNAGDLQTASVPYCFKNSSDLFPSMTKITVRDPVTAADKELVMEEKRAKEEAERQEKERIAQEARRQEEERIRQAEEAKRQEEQKYEFPDWVRYYSWVYQTTGTGRYGQPVISETKIEFEMYPDYSGPCYKMTMSESGPVHSQNGTNVVRGDYRYENGYVYLQTAYGWLTLRLDESRHELINVNNGQTFSRSY